jgi:RHS repeat-associated protein
LTQETSRSGGVTQYFYDDPHSELPTALQDATGSRKQMTWSRYEQLLTFTDCSGYETRYEYDRFGQLTAVHQQEGISLYQAYDNRGRLVGQRDTQGRETRYEYSTAGDLTAVISPDGSRSDTAFDAWGNIISTLQDGLTRRMEYDAAGRVIQLTNENGSHTVFTYDALDRLTQETGFDGRTQRYGYAATGQLIRSEAESIVTLWHYDASDRLTHRTVNGEPAEQWCYDERGWLTEISHLSDGHRVATEYKHNKQGRLISERQTVHHPETNALLWQHETRHDYSDKGLANRVTPDTLPPVEWLTYGSGYLAGMKLGDSPLIDFTRDRLHRETLRTFGEYELTTAYTPGGLLQSHHLNLPQLNRDYSWNSDGQLVRISGQHAQRDYQYGAAGRLLSTHITSSHHDLVQWTFTDPAGNRTAARDKYPMLPERFPDNRISRDVANFYHYDEHGRLTEKDERHTHLVSHHYSYDNQHRLTHHRQMQQGSVLAESRYLYDPLGRRICKRVWKSQEERDLNGDKYLWLNSTPQVTWYGWDGDRLTTTQTDKTRIQTVYLPGSFTPLIRIETATGELARALRRTLAQKLQQDAGMTFVPELVAMLDGLEAELRRGEISAANQQWLAQCGLTPEQMKNQMEPEYTPVRKIHLYHCDHRGLPQALINSDGKIDWSAEYDAWSNVLSENNPHNLQQLIRLPGQQWDKETGLYYNRHRYYDPLQGRYITQDPIGLKGGWNLYQYPLNPTTNIDPFGLNNLDVIVNNNGIGHVGLHMGSGNSELLYDPGGSYMTPQGIPSGSGGTFMGSDANLNNYLKYQYVDGSKVKVYSFEITPDEDKKIRVAIDEQGGCSPLYCALCSSSVLNGIGPFKNLGTIRTPWGMENAMSEFLYPKPDAPFGSFLISPAY